jgi:hypothetical protein
MPNSGAMVQDVLTAVLALATVLLAAYTGMMMRATRTVAEKTAALAQETQDLAKQTIAANTLADQHHQEALTPCVVLTRGFVIGQPNELMLKDVDLWNVGPGPALDVRVWIAELGEPVQVGSIASGNALTNVQCRVITLGQTKPNESIKLVVLYKNLFGQEGRTIHFGNVGSASFTMVLEPPSISKRLP